MSKIVLLLGAIVFSLLMYSVPIIVVLSFVYDWDGYYQFLLVIAAGVQFLFLVSTVLNKVEED